MNSADIDRYIDSFIKGGGKSGGRRPKERYASFDYCFNYFQQFKDDETLSQMADNTHLQFSCLQLGFYLASWGMYRGSTHLHQKSAKIFEPIIKTIASLDEDIWRIDADQYTAHNINRLIQSYNLIGESFAEAFGGASYPSDTLVSKVMLGVFGNVPAFDDNFKIGFACKCFDKDTLKVIGHFYARVKLGSNLYS
jgi:hypothetical protein